jgi:thiosulfate/3-mercaptopyruvate sulfurtransferase
MVLDTYWAAQIVGGLVFGAGFVIGGWCPGTALVGLASAKWDALVFLVGAMLGSILFNEFYPLVRPVYEGFHQEALVLPVSLGLDPRHFPLAVSIIAVVAFALSTWMEKRYGGLPMPALKRQALHAGAALLLVAAAAGTLLLPPPTPATGATRAGTETGSQNTLPTFLSETEDAVDHISPETLAEQLMAGAPDLTLIDIRPAADTNEFTLRGARRVPLPDLLAAVGNLPPGQRVVLFSNGTTHAAQAWTELRYHGYSNAYVLTDGILGFWRDCLTPPSLQPGLDADAARARAQDFMRRRDYFLSPDGACGPQKVCTPPTGVITSR